MSLQMLIFVALLSLTRAAPQVSPGDEQTVIKEAPASSSLDFYPEGQVQPRQERRYDNLLQQENALETTIEIITADEEDAIDDEEDEEDNFIALDSDRGLVPQLWANYTGPPEPPAESVSCEVARVKCSYRAGCGLALQNYALGCAELAAGRTDQCSTHCRHALIALMSTHEGQRLMKCDCHGEEFCTKSKERVASCASSVLDATKEHTVVTCSAAQWICGADPQCAMAFEYYQRFCGALFRGRSCSSRCKNSIAILRRQRAASKLESCVCDGSEPFDCRGIKDNMERLCYPQKDTEDGANDSDLHTNEIPSSGAAMVSGPRILLLLALATWLSSSRRLGIPLVQC